MTILRKYFTEESLYREKFGQSALVLLVIGDCTSGPFGASTVFIAYMDEYVIELRFLGIGATVFGKASC